MSEPSTPCDGSEANLANTHQTVKETDINTYTLGPRPGLLNDREARCLRHNREPLDFIAAAVLHRALTCSREARAREALIDPAEARAAAARLIAAGLLAGRPPLPPTNAPGPERRSRQPPERRSLR